VQIKSDPDLVLLGFPTGSLPEPLEVPLQPLLERLGEERLRIYMSHEMPLVLSTGCMFNCNFCAADIGRRETFKDLDSFRQDLEYMARKAKEFGLAKLEFYSTSLDFFQTPRTLVHYLQVLAEVRQQSGVDIKVRALSCLVSFVFADRVIPNLGQLLKAAGFYCVGFGVDGVKEVWASQGKQQNREQDIPRVLQRTAEMGLEVEILMIMGDKRYDARLLAKTVVYSYRFITDWKHTVLRLHMAKVWPASNDWENAPPAYKDAPLKDPSLFTNLDALAFASRVTHPDTKQRRQANMAYLCMMLPLRLVGRCVSGTIIPQGGKGAIAILGQHLNPYLPYDR
jgi:hypothetical protein